jgi:GNAT superfamily N-acetyltransferase
VIEIRPVSGMEQLERWVALRNTIRPDDPEDAAMKALLRAQEPDHVDLLASVDGEPAGTAMLSGDAESEASGRPWMEIDVLPAYRGRGVGTALLNAVSEEARRQGRTALACETSADDAYSLSFLERRGFSLYRRWEQLALDLDAGTGLAPAAPEPVEITSIAERPALLAGMYAVAAATYPELGDYMARHAESFVKWQVYELGNAAVRLDLVPLAVVDATVVGFATMRTLLDAATAELKMVAVLPEWRGRGIARALLAAQAAGAWHAGMRRLTTWVPRDGPVGLYRRVGFEPVGEYFVLHGPLS